MSMTVKNKYVVISAANDYHLPFVEPHLDEQFTVIDWKKIPEKTAASFYLRKNGFLLSWGGEAVYKPKSVWFRKPVEISPRSFSSLHEPDAVYAAGALTQFNQQILSHFSDAFWVSDYYAIRRAMSKKLQLEVAQRIGFNVPDTLITSSAAEASAFVNRHQETIVKPIDIQPYIREGKTHLFLTHKIDKQSINYDGLHLAPAIFQEAIPVKADIRVTVVGNQTFAATVSGSAVNANSSNVRDWRIAHHEGDMAVRACELPKHIADACVAHVSSLGLAFGAIDLILDKKGKYWFLENNPNGQWAFVEEMCGQPIGKAVATLLMQGKTNA